MTVRHSFTTSALLAAAVLAPALSHAEDKKWYDKVTLGGYAEAFYVQSINTPALYANSSPINGGISNTVPLRAFDIMPNQADYNGELTVKYADDASKTGAFLDLVYGNKANIILGSSNYGATANTDPSIVLGQAYLTEAFGPLTFTLGKFGTPVGYEVWNTTANANFSRSMVYTLEPFYQLGAKVDYAAPASTTVSLWLDNGNSVDRVPNNGKNLGAALANSSVKDLALTLVWYLDHSAIDTPVHFINVIAAYTVSDKLSLAAEYLYKTTLNPNPNNSPTIISPKTQGYALYASYTLAGLTVSPRFESVFNPDNGNPASGASGNSLQYNDLTLTLKYPVGPVSNILEYRADSASNFEFATTDATAPSQVNQTVTYAAVYGF